ncbi:failed axon connections homolog [Octopus sinensis]|uniref:Failed axon connections homolog n=1 Tax=Octopus sinensis TaxID=2607531 RepID=A0A6P7SHH9_9MOLL|nr:failed axon connections homolog [Octopus sinensis]
MSQWTIAVGVGLITASGLLYIIFRQKKKKIYPENVIILHQFPRIREAPNISPFAIKLETFLRMAKLPYQVEYTFEMSPKHKIPWITYNGEVVSDSQFIIEYLNKKFNLNFNSHLTDEQRSIARAMQKMLEENLYWGLVRLRWVYGNSYTRKIIPMLAYQYWLIKRRCQRSTYCQGIGRHTLAEVNQIVMDDLKALSDFLGKKKFLMGDELCETDFAIFGMIAYSRQMPENCILKEIIDDDVFPNITAYFERMKSMYWPDWFDPTVKFPTFGLQPQKSHFTS